MPEPVAFAAPLLLRGTDGMRMLYVPLPDELAAAYADVRRVVVALNGVEVRRGLLRSGAERFVMVSQAMAREMGAAYGDTVVVDLAPDPEPDRIDLGPLADALAADAEAKARWDTITPGRQRGLAHYVTSARRPETQAARAAEIARKLATHTLYGDLRPPPA